MHCERPQCTEAVWQTQASNGYGTCGAQIEWVQANVASVGGQLTEACTYVAEQASTPECAPCGPPTALSPPPSPPPVSCWSEERPGSTAGDAIAEHHSSSLEHCKHLCRAADTCKSVTFSARAHSCRLMDRHAAPDPTTDDSVVASFNFELCFTAKVAGRARGDKLGRKRKAATLEACQRLCRLHPECKSFNYRPTEWLQGAQGTCHLRNTFYDAGNEFRANNGRLGLPVFVQNFLFSDFCQHGIVSVSSFDATAATTSRPNFQVGAPNPNPNPNPNP